MVGPPRHDLRVVFEDQTRAKSFGADAEQYDRSRPGYPERLVADLLADDARLAVDVGCGTGIVAHLLSERGCRVVGVEPDDRMAAVARRKGVEVEVARFEDWDPRERQFDLLTSGQAWHWVHPSIKADKAAQVLRPGGRFGVFWHGLRHTDDVAAGFRLVYGRLAPELLVDSVALGTVRPTDASDEGAFAATGKFVELEQRSYDWTRHYTTEQWVDELPTHSAHRVLPPALLQAILGEITALLESLGGEITVHYRTAGVFGRRR
jgi:SAM-dependent methyltransferase